MVSRPAEKNARERRLGNDEEKYLLAACAPQMALIVHLAVQSAARLGEPTNSFLVDLRFHDCRHEATSRLFERGVFDSMEVASITGHKTLAMLKRYTHLKSEDLAKKLG
jgi:site-specific recombinase XerD